MTVEFGSVEEGGGRFNALFCVFIACVLGCSSDGKFSLFKIVLAEDIKLVRNSPEFGYALAICPFCLQICTEENSVRCVKFALILVSFSPCSLKKLDGEMKVCALYAVYLNWL